MWEMSGRSAPGSACDSALLWPVFPPVFLEQLFIASAGWRLCTPQGLMGLWEAHS
jgi:hypothetical protein